MAGRKVQHKCFQSNIVVQFSWVPHKKVKYISSMQFSAPVLVLLMYRIHQHCNNSQKQYCTTALHNLVVCPRPNKLYKFNCPFFNNFYQTPHNCYWNSSFIIHCPPGQYTSDMTWFIDILEENKKNSTYATFNFCCMRIISAC